MKRLLASFLILSLCTLPLHAQPACAPSSELSCFDPCDPCAPICGTSCGVTVCSVALAVGLVVGVAAIILSTGDSISAHTHND